MEMVILLRPAATLGLVCAGGFFLTGLVTGAWKYRCMITSEDARSPYYVDIAHRASLLYSFACLLLAAFAQLSAWSEPVNLAGVAVPVVLFAGAVKSYVFHGWLKDTDNQLRRPHRLGRWTVPPAMMRLAMTAVIVGEIGGFLVLFTGFLVAILGG
jgi:hypothetical protein